MPGLSRIDLRIAWQRNACQDGDTTFFVVPLNKITKVAALHVDTTHASGRTGNIRIQVLDTFGAIGGTSGQVNRFQTQVQAGDVGDILLPGPIQIFGALQVNCNYSGPIISIGTIQE